MVEPLKIHKNMKKDFISVRPSGSEKKHEPKAIGEVLSEYFKSDEPLAVAYRGRLCREIFPNTYPCVDVKTLLHERTARVGQAYRGVLVRDGEEHFTFVENSLGKRSAVVRHPHVFRGRCINITRRDNGTMQPTFNRPKLTAEFAFCDFCREAAEELLYVARLVKEETM